MQKDERDLLDVLRFELEFLEKGGYSPSPREPRKMNFIFEDSPTCMNYDSKDNPGPCNDCVLMALVPPGERNQTIPCRHIPLDAEGHTLEQLYRQADPQGIEDIYSKWLRATIAKLVEDREKRSGETKESTSAPEARTAGSPSPLGEPLFGKMHPKCANPACPAAFHWLAGGRFFRFKPGELTPTTKTEAAEASGEPPKVKHYWLCETCSHTYTLNYYVESGVVVEPRWRELPLSEPLKQISVARR